MTGEVARRVADEGLTVEIGGNRFVDCNTLISIGGQTLLRVEANPLRLSLTTPPDLPSGRRVSVVQNNLDSESGSVIVVTADSNVSIFWGKGASSPVSMVLATRLDAHRVHLKLDLRPLGILVYDDIDGLHVGGNALCGNTIRGATVAISLK
ncbi:MAG: hypothetical protein HYY84_12535 [Deltaproteobacteria bacterium]|nr:hypothetical protein [Deltaproteobacteria bacterium]